MAQPDAVLTALPHTVSIREVGPRDGLQNEATIPVAERVRLIDALSATGLRRIEAGAFVHPAAIPPMAGSEDVFAQITRVPGVVYSALVPNVRGVERAVAAGADELEMVLSASDTHNRKNVKRSTDESMAQIPEMIAAAHGAGVPVQAIVATAFGCPYEGDVDPARVAELALRQLDAGADTVAFGDTTGMATPARIAAVLDALGDLDRDLVTLHLHDTRGTGLTNLFFGLQEGITHFDASIGGLGGCPYAPGASGNIVTEDAVHLLDDLGIATGIDLAKLLDCAALARDLVSRDLPSAVLAAGPRSRTVPTS